MAISSSLVSLLSLVGIYAILAIGLNIKFGYTGLLEIGHVAFYLIGAYTAALLVSPPATSVDHAVYALGWNWPWIPAVLAGMLVAGIAGTLVSLPAVRLREDYFAMVTLGVSIIVMRVVQVEEWIANGPDSLSTFDLPLRSLVPLPQPTVESAVLFGIVVGIIFGTATYGLPRLLDSNPSTSFRSKVVHALLAVTSLGLGYGVARYSRRTDAPTMTRLAVGVGLLTGLVATVASLFAGDLAVLVLFVFLGAASLLTWVVAGVLTARYVEPFSRRELLTSVGIALGLVVAIAPVILVPSLLSAIGTLLLIGGYGVAVYRIGIDWAEYGGEVSFMKVVAASGIVLFVLRYFVMSVLQPLVSGDVGTVIFDTVQNVVWLVQFTTTGLEFDYSRLVLVGTLLILAGVYVIAELIVNSPYGRVLTAIREDEQVTATLGKSVFTYKVQSMALGSMIAGLAGGLTAIYFRSLTYNMFHPRVTFFVFLILIVGGMANNKGMILGALIYWGFQRGTGDIAALFPSGDMRTRIQAFRLALFGLLFVALLYYRPEGLLGRRTSATGSNDE